MKKLITIMLVCALLCTIAVPAGALSLRRCENGVGWGRGGTCENTVFLTRFCADCEPKPEPKPEPEIVSIRQGVRIVSNGVTHDAISLFAHATSYEDASGGWMAGDGIGFFFGDSLFESLLNGEHNPVLGSDYSLPTVIYADDFEILLAEAISGTHSGKITQYSLYNIETKEVTNHNSFSEPKNGEYVLRISADWLGRTIGERTEYSAHVFFFKLIVQGREELVTIPVPDTTTEPGWSCIPIILPGVLRGDVTGTGVITINDALEIIVYLAGLDSVLDNPASFDAARAITGGASPTINDALEILMYLAGLPSVFDNKP
jgi:hypothetical protein